MAGFSITFLCCNSTSRCSKPNYRYVQLAIASHSGPLIIVTLNHKTSVRERVYLNCSDIFHSNSNDRYVFSSHFQLNVRTPQLNLYITRTRKLLTSKAEGEILCFFLHSIAFTYSIQWSVKTKRISIKVYKTTVFDNTYLCFKP